jgi:hypothetical protein
MMTGTLSLIAAQQSGDALECFLPTAFLFIF